MIIVQDHAVRLLRLRTGWRLSRSPIWTGRRFGVLTISRHEADRPEIHVSGIAVQGQGIVSSVETAVGMDVAINCHRGSGMNLHAIGVEDRVSPKGKNLLLEDPPYAGDDVVWIARVTQIRSGGGKGRNYYVSSRE